ncbi:MAG: ribosome biogenesis GTPase Der, partial [Candidatus Aminicenantes bacterium]|nr:ribosome biogenesis GTPase Der [Candidatus Aminicenantes bacterium]
ARKKVPTSRLNSFLIGMSEKHPPFSKKGKRLKVKYMVQKGILPPAFILFTHSHASLDSSYEKFFVRLLREEFGFWGTPLRLMLRRN